MANNKQMETKLYNLVSCLADNFGFDADAAFEYARWETDVDHVGEILKLISTDVEKPKKEAPKKEVKDDASEAPTESSAGGDVMEKIAACKKNIALWQSKLDDGKVKDAAKQREKIDKEKAKLAKLEAKAPKVVEEKPKPAAKKEEEKEKRIKRFSPVMASQLKTALESAGVEMNDKLKKEFQQFVEDLTDDDYRASGLADHMRAFAKLKAPAKKVEEPEDDEDCDESEDEEEKPKGPFPPPTSNVAGGGPENILVSLKELQAIQMTAEMGTPGTFWDADNGRFVKGPEAIEDEDATDVKFDGKTYSVGDNTGRVYLVVDPDDENSKTIFAGFIGVGKFKDMKMP